MFALTLIALTLIAAPAAAEPAPPRLTACITVRWEARYRNYGYDQLVHVQNGCKRSATCQVATDVTPQAKTVVVEPQKTATVITRIGSPSRQFKPKVSCQLD